MLVLKKIWSWLKHYWHVPLLVVLVVVFSLLLGRSPNKKLWEVVDKQRDAHKKELEILEQAAAEKRKTQEEAAKKHTDTLKNIEKEYNIEIEKLEEEKKKEINDLAEKHQDRPDELARAVAAALSAEYSKTEWERKQ
tara:strand:+ start:5611 stop:6021 length:411 start_codon:yes stop_codon:yes gene_type:complete